MECEPNEEETISIHVTPEQLAAFPKEYPDTEMKVIDHQNVQQPPITEIPSLLKLCIHPPKAPVKNSTPCPPKEWQPSQAGSMSRRHNCSQPVFLQCELLPP